MKPLLLLLCIAIDVCTGASNAERCNAPTHLPGPQCMAYIERFTFNKARGQCEKFVYGGCNPSPNNFETLEECTAACVRKTV